jgi:hypothetical protein
MSIAVNPDKRPSPFGGTEGGCGLPLKQFSAPPNGEGVLAVTIYEHVASNGAKSDR